ARSSGADADRISVAHSRIRPQAVHINRRRSERWPPFLVEKPSRSAPGARPETHGRADRPAAGPVLGAWNEAARLRSLPPACATLLGGGHRPCELPNPLSPQAPPGLPRRRRPSRPLLE